MQAVTTNVIVQLHELTDNDEHEYLCDILADKIQDKHIDVYYIQIMCYSIVGHTADTLTFEVEWRNEV